jgi:Fe2+ transport system protein FeoA
MMLSECRQGDSVSIERVGGRGAIRKRLLEMGFTRGERIAVVKYAPLRDPMEVTVKGFHISLRVSEARLVEVRKAAV